MLKGCKIKWNSWKCGEDGGICGGEGGNKVSGEGGDECMLKSVKHVALLRKEISSTHSQFHIYYFLYFVYNDCDRIPLTPIEKVRTLEMVTTEV